jgi:hypothetical protein
MCGNGAEVDVWGRVGAKSVCGRGGSRFTAWDWCGGKFASLHKGLLTQVRAFSSFFITTHVLIICCTCCKYVVYYSHFSTLQVKINHVMEIQNMSLFLGPLAWLRTITHLSLRMIRVNNKNRKKLNNTK